MYKPHLDNLTINDLLKTYGIDARRVTVTRNGIDFTGYQLVTDDSNVCPVVYPANGETLDELKERIIRVAAAERPGIDVSELTDFSRIRDKLYLTIQRRSREDVVKRNYLNLEVLPRIFLDLDGNTGKVKISNELIHALGVTEQDVWDAATDNSDGIFVVKSMAEIFRDMFGEECPEGGDDGLYVVTAAPEFYDAAAAALCFPGIFRDFCLKHGEQTCYVLPSSTQEVLVVPGSRVESEPGMVRTMSQMVDDINNDMVDAAIQLDPVVYRYSMADGVISIAADARREEAVYGR